MWLSFFLWAGAFLLAELLRPKAKVEDARPTGIDEVNVPTATEGRKIPIVVGRVRVSGPNVLWWGDYRANPLRQTVKTGLFNDQKVITGFEYYLAMQLAVCRGPIDGVARVWYGDKIIYDGADWTDSISIDDPEFFGGESRAGGISFTLTLERGVTDAPRNDFLEPRQRLNATPNTSPTYQNIAYVVLNDGADAGGFIGRQASLRPIAFEPYWYPNSLGVAGGAERIGDDANPICFLYELLVTNEDWGLQVPVAQVDVATLQQVAADVATEGLGFSMSLEQPRPAGDIVAEIERHVDGYFYWDQTATRYTMRLNRQDYIPGNLLTLDESNFILEEFGRPNWSETFNEARLEYSDREKEYNTSAALAQDMANRQIQAKRVPVTLRYPGVKSAAVANLIVWRTIRSGSQPFAKIKGRANRDAYELVGGAPFLLSWADKGISQLPARIVRINKGADDNMAISIDAIEDVFDAEVGTYADPPPTNFVPPVAEVTPIPFLEQLVIEMPPLIGPTRSIVVFASNSNAGSPEEFEIWYEARTPPAAFTDVYALESVKQAFTPLGKLSADYAPALGSVGNDGGKQLDSTDTLEILPWASDDIQDAVTAASGDEVNADFANLVYIVDRRWRVIFSGNPANAETVEIGDTIYTFVNAVSADGDVLIGATQDDTLTNLHNAINNSGGSAGDYQVAAANTEVTAEALNTAADEFLLAPQIANGVTFIDGTAGDVAIESPPPPEFVAAELVTNIASEGVRLNRVWRGLLDTVPVSHRAGAQAWFIGNGASRTVLSFDAADEVQIKIAPISQSDSVLPANAPELDPVLIAGRGEIPAPLTYVQLNGNDVWDLDGVSLDFNVTFPTETLPGLQIAFDGRDPLTTGALWQALGEPRERNGTSGASLGGFAQLEFHGGYENSTTTDRQHKYKWWLYLDDDPGDLSADDATRRATAELSGETDVSPVNELIQLTRLQILEAAGGTPPTKMVIEVQTVDVSTDPDTDGGFALLPVTNVTTAVTSLTLLGELADDTISASIPVSAYQSTSLNISLGYPLSQYAAPPAGMDEAGLLQYRLSGGAWVTLLDAIGADENQRAATLPVGATDTTLEFRHSHGRGVRIVFEVSTAGGAPIASGALVPIHEETQLEESVLFPATLPTPIIQSGSPLRPVPYIKLARRAPSGTQQDLREDIDSEVNIIVDNIDFPRHKLRFDWTQSHNLSSPNTPANGVAVGLVTNASATLDRALTSIGADPFNFGYTNPEAIRDAGRMWQDQVDFHQPVVVAEDGSQDFYIACNLQRRTQIVGNFETYASQPVRCLVQRTDGNVDTTIGMIMFKAGDQSAHTANVAGATVTDSSGGTTPSGTNTPTGSVTVAQPVPNGDRLTRVSVELSASRDLSKLWYRLGTDVWKQLGTGTSNYAVLPELVNINDPIRMAHDLGTGGGTFNANWFDLGITAAGSNGRSASTVAPGDKANFLRFPIDDS